MPSRQPVLSGVSGATTVAGVIGDPVAHSLSPALHNAAYRAMGLDWVYVAMPVAAGNAVAAVLAVRTLGLGGLSVTMPHKSDAVSGVDDLTPVAARLGSLNTVIRDGDRLLGDSTDGEGLLAALRASQDFEPAGTAVVVLGTGGAASAVVDALASAGAGAVTVVGRNAEGAARVAALAGVAGRAGGIDAVAGADLVVNATPVGMEGEAVLPFGLDPRRLGAGQLVVDLLYRPERSALLSVADAAGAATANGLGMLVHQAAAQIRRWSGEEPPIDAMWRAATAG